ncbi:VOC family protein [Niveispirillum sp.]|uniref:VOC family protein n=1 Tax=Niveispirillum sp. TaxID=1917217 RepID=UPI001B52C785|nr:VOC family protein [Niveispirillum sp.]MBP7334998.1 VOC family protein [Niveispirillum sp.]
MSEQKPHLIRHFVLASPDIDAISARIQSFLKVPQGHRHDMGAILGFRNEMMMIGETMFELVQPVKPDHRLHRWFQEQGGEGGYMIVFQTFDADAFRDRAAAEKLRLTRDMLFRGQDMIQFDPKRFGTHLETYRYTLPNGWWGDPVGRKYGRSEAASEIVAADVAVNAAPPAEIAAQVGRLFLSPVEGDRVRFPGKQVRFVPAAGRAGLVALDFKATDPSAVGRVERICNMEFRLV